MSYVLPAVAAVVAVVLLSGCGVEEFIERQPLPVGKVPPSTLAPIARPYPNSDYFTTTSSTNPPCDLTAYLCGRTESAYSDD